MLHQNYDAIIIGSGLGGLSCGAYLSKNKWKVVVLEKNNFPGGYASSFKNGHFTFDASLHMLDGVEKGKSMYYFLEKCGIGEKIEYIKLEHFARLIFPEHDIRLPSGNLDALVKILENEFPHEREGIKALFKKMVRVHDDTLKFLKSTTPMLLQLPIFPIRYRALFPVMRKTTKHLIDKYLHDEKLKAILFANYGFYGLPPSKLNVTAVFANMDYWVSGAYYPKGGNQVIPDALVDLIRDNGGNVILNSEVTEIIIENKKAVGVITKQGEMFRGNEIISNISAIETFNNLIGREKLPTKFLKKLDRMEPSVSTIIVYIGLDENFKSKLKYNEDYELFVSNTYDLDEDQKLSMDNNVQEASFFITIYTNVNPSLANGDRSIVCLVQGQNFEHWKKYETDYNNGKKEEYNKEKNRLAQILIKRAEQILPDLSEHIEVMSVSTPLTLKRFSGNTDGAFFGWATNVKQYSPMDRLTKLPIKNLYLSSAWSFPGGGQTSTIAGGYRVAQKLI